MRFLALLAALWVGLGAAAAQQIEVTNRVFLVPDRPGSTTRFEMIVNAGSSDEAGGDVKGIAHYLEHLILVGRNVEHGDAVLRMFADASSNGWTNDRATVYLHNLPARPDGGAADIDKLFGFYAARLRDFSITDADAARERNVVLQEHDWRVQQNPTSLFYRDVSRALVPNHPAGMWTIGTRDSIQAMTMAEARAFHASWYHRANVWFVVRGDIPPERLKEIAERHLASLPDKPMPERLSQKPPALDGQDPVLRMRNANVSRTLVTMARLVRIEEPDRLRADATMSLLSAFANSRFTGSAHDILVEEKRVASEDASVSVRRVAPGTFAISVAASVAADRTEAELREAMAGYLDMLPNVGVPQEPQLQRLKTRVADQFERTSKQPLQVHSRLVSWLADRRPPERLAEWPQLVQSITRAELVTLANGLRGAGRRLTGTLSPVEGNAP